MPDFAKIYLFRMTHIENIPHIFQFGITHLNSSNSNHNFVPIGDSSLINKRNEYILENGRRLGEYIPFYFGGRMPMLYVIQNGYNSVAPIPPEQIVYCITSVQKIIELGQDFVFTDGHAVDSFSTLYTTIDINNIDTILDMEAIKAIYWKDENDLDKKRRKEAEFLILGDIPSNAVLGYIVYNKDSKNRLIDFGIDSSLIYINQKYYF